MPDKQKTLKYLRFLLVVLGILFYGGVALILLKVNIPPYTLLVLVSVAFVITAVAYMIKNS